MKSLALTLFAVFAALSAHASPDAASCVSIEPGAQYQLVPVDGTIEVFGQIPTKPAFGFDTNPVVAETLGSEISFNVYETQDITKLGVFLGTVAKAQITATGSPYGDRGCDLRIEGSKLGKHRMFFLAASVRGDIILQNYDAASPLHFLIIKKISKLR